jgi:arylsulfatase
MPGSTNEILVAPYTDLDAARVDFDALVALVKDKSVAVEGAILVAHEADGNVTVVDTGDRLGRKGAGWGGGVGLIVGLFQPELIPAIAMGATGGGLVGRFASHRLQSGLADKLGQALPPGSAGVIVVSTSEHRLAIERALPGSPVQSVIETDEKGLLGALKNDLAAAMGKFNPDRTKLPIPDPPFGGVIGRTMDSSQPDWSIVAPVKPPADAPNVLVVLVDDAGFGNTDTFGGPIATPTMTRVRESGLTYNRFHVTAVCSPTRAAMLTGRNHHRVGMGSIVEFPGPFPGYTGAVPRSCAPLPRILSENGYVTGGFGKWHLTPDNVQGAAGPFDRWPQAWGFNHWWGFLSGAAGQFDPVITQDNTVIGVPESEKDGPYYFPDDITDKAVEWLHQVRAQDAEKPWFMYYSTGCAHAPHHILKEWGDKYRGRFDEGWDVLREQTLARQKELGIVPEDTELTERPDLFPAWDSLDEEAKKLYARQMEVYAGYSENADWNVGRLLDEIEEMGERDNTLIIYVWGDNGASMEGTTTGSFNEMTFLNGIVLEPDHQLELINEYGGIDELGGEHSAPHYAAAWAHAGNTPFKWGKQVASHLGGTRDPMVVSWPDRIKPDLAVRDQFTHCIDIGPTVLEAVGLPVPEQVDGIEQEPMDGTSFLYTFDEPAAPERHTEQYFEILGSRAMYKDGWWACFGLDKKPWDFSAETVSQWGPGSGYDPDDDQWELYYLPDDFSQAHNIAGRHPEKVAELQELWWKEAERNRALPLMGAFSIFYGILPPMPTRTRFTIAGDVQNLQRGVIPRTFGRSYAIEGELIVPESGASGVIVANADMFGGFSLWVDEHGILKHTYSLLGVKKFRQEADRPLPSGAVKVKMLLELDENKPGSGGEVTLHINDEQVGSGRIDQTVPIAFSSYAAMDVGRDNGLVVDMDYEPQAPYAFNGTVKNVVFDLSPVHHEGEKELHEVSHQHHLAAGISG